jgi:hypothetical protein
VPHTYADYRLAASILWGAAGRFAVDEQRRLNRRYFGDALPPLSVVVGLTAYGRCLGLTRPRDRSRWTDQVPRITLASNLFASGTGAVSDTVLHEMVHAKLMLAGQNPQHNATPWCAEICRISPLLDGGRAILAAPVTTRYVNNVSCRPVRPGHLTRADLATWPHSLRRPRRRGEVLAVASY